VSLITYIREVRVEVSKIVWPTVNEAMTVSGVVIALVFVASLFFFIVDFFLSFLIGIVLGILQ